MKLVLLILLLAIHCHSIAPTTAPIDKERSAELPLAKPTGPRTLPPQGIKERRMPSDSDANSFHGPTPKSNMPAPPPTFDNEVQIRMKRVHPRTQGEIPTTHRSPTRPHSDHRQQPAKKLSTGDQPGEAICDEATGMCIWSDRSSAKAQQRDLSSIEPVAVNSAEEDDGQEEYYIEIFPEAYLEHLHYLSEGTTIVGTSYAALFIIFVILLVLFGVCFHFCARVSRARQRRLKGKFRMFREEAGYCTA